MKKRIRTLSFFSGCGGLDLGFHKAGFDILYASDIEEIFCESLNRNKPRYFSQSQIIENIDIRDINPENLPDDIDFIIGGPPCQSFSASGRRAGGAAGQQDKRGTLFQAYGNIIKAKNPAGFLFENVRGILSSNKGKDWEEIKKYFLNIGYILNYRILDACDYGIAQYRERLIMVGHKLKAEFNFPRPIFGPDSSNNIPHFSAKTAINGAAHDEDINALEFSGGKYSHLLKEVPEGGNYLYFTEKRGYPKPIFAYRSRFSDFLYKADPNKPTKTLIASPGKYTGPLHWENRYFSVSEYLRLQGFPDDYTVCGKRADRVKQIGNSVSPKMAEILGYTVKKQIFGAKLIPENIEFIDSLFPLSFDKRKGKQAKKTREKHLYIASQNDGKNKKFAVSEYSTEVYPHSFVKPLNNVQVVLLSNGKWLLKVRSDNSRKLYASMNLKLGKTTVTLLSNSFEVDLVVKLYGEREHSIQTMWNAVDDFVIRSSNYHSLFELYGHFTEPHPDFEISIFTAYSDHPVCQFAEYASNFLSCSRFINRKHLTSMFSQLFEINNFVDLMEYLRSFRFDIRSKEINVAINKESYMIAYPFTLPNRKQMNFKPKALTHG
jgi:DNA (cytosine-5)-methyltransferase 1